MFGFRKKKEQKKQGQLDKILMGVIVGGAIGSVVGVGLAPKKGSETRREVGKKTGRLLQKAGGLFKSLAGKVVRQKQNIRHEIKTPTDIKYTGRSIPEEK